MHNKTKPNVHKQVIATKTTTMRRCKMKNDENETIKAEVLVMVESLHKTPHEKAWSKSIKVADILYKC